MRLEMQGHGSRKPQIRLQQTQGAPSDPQGKLEENGVRYNSFVTGKTTILELPHDFFDIEFPKENGADGLLPITPDDWNPELPEWLLWQKRLGIYKDIHAFKAVEYIYGFKNEPSCTLLEASEAFNAHPLHQQVPSPRRNQQQ